MPALLESLRGFDSDQTGQTTVEYALLLGGFALPIYWLLMILLSMLADFYKMISFLHGMPLP